LDAERHMSPLQAPELAQVLARRRLPGAWEAAALLARLFFRQTLGRRRVLWAALGMLVPLGMAAYWRLRQGGSGEGFFLEMTVNVFLQFISLGLPLYLGVSAVRDELEDRTLVFLLARPVERWVILAGKLGAVAVVVALGQALLVAGVYAIVVSADGAAALLTGLARLAQVVGVLALASLVYTGLFGLCGVLFRHPMIPALVVAIGWEGAVANLPGAFPRLSAMFYLKSLLGLGPEAQGLLTLLLPAAEPASALTSLVVLCVLTCLLLGLAVSLGARKEAA
jgi:ABC-2 type transport system permease protein